MNILHKLDNTTLQQINNCKVNYIIETNSTNEINLKLLKKIKNKKTIFIIKSALGDEKYYFNADDKYRKRTIFSLRQVKKIIKQFCKIDKVANKESCPLKKVFAIYKYLAISIRYEDKNCFSKNGQDIRRTLYSIVSKKAVCSGFALILFEALQRNNIESYYLHSQNHLFNVVKINNHHYPLDVTWESALKQKNKDKLFHFFGNYPLFEKNHILVEKEPKFDYSYIESKNLHPNNINLKTHKCQRDDNSIFYIAQLPIGNQMKFYVVKDDLHGVFDIIYSLQDFDRVFNGNDEILTNCYKNSLLKGERLKEKIKTNNGHVGYGEIQNGIFYKHNQCDQIITTNASVKNNSLKFEYLGDFYSIAFKKNRFQFTREKIC